VNALLNSLTEAELALVRETEPERLAELDEDALVELHTRIRRARNKYVGVYRRGAASRVEETGGRGKSYARNSRSRAKAEVFEDALARVSEHLAVAARASAEALKAERLAEARRGRNSAPPTGPVPRPAARRTDQQLDRQPDFTGLHKRHASTRSTGARRQARRDSR
jgi:ribonuclease D